MSPCALRDGDGGGGRADAGAGRRERLRAKQKREREREWAVEDERVCAYREDAGGGERARELLLLLVSATISICPRSRAPTPR